jgi:preprotein translocase subunit SecD
MTIMQRRYGPLSRQRGRFCIPRSAGPIAIAGLLLATAAGAEPLTIDIREAHVDRDRRTGQVIVSIALAESSKVAFGRFSESNVGHRMELRRDGKPIVAFVIREPLLGGTFQIGGVSDAAAVVEQLSIGKGTVQVEILPD